MKSRPAPTVSIVTPCLDQAPFLEATIQSVLSQSYPHLDYVVMDGGSTDGSLAGCGKTVQKRVTAEMF